ncbi:endonuclease/exonuclease/phosphatase family protein [Micromonospora coxensis]|uniref:Metal-dependent hydrolase, endonuclease/exonuclease/phosphatase family n=1 Tax=Micromonospora coxensis TaxID=356852 RepID=A0A1C5JSZ2_9ACTN|nr:endonuclease/exonuclease/phosphatase family protein [Micromonospora coxensis]SCG73710.1 Metal-dependent hydrolase, endonuclease/exonuclease/phosphatase family [Micromonospora coxensis]
MSAAHPTPPGAADPAVSDGPAPPDALGPVASGAVGPAVPGVVGPVASGAVGPAVPGVVGPTPSGAVGPAVPEVVAAASGAVGPAAPPVVGAVGSAAGGRATAPTARTRWCPGTRLLVAVALGWLLLTALHRLLTGRWWFWLLPDLLPPVAYVLVPVLLALAVPAARLLRRPVPSRPRTVVLTAAALALGLGLPDAGLNRYALTGGRVAPPADALRVLVWNTGYWDQDDDPDAFLRFLVAQRADVYLLQEHLYWDATAGLRGARPAPDPSRLRAVFPGYTVVARGELLTLSRYPVLARPPVGPDAVLPAEADSGRVFAAAKVLRTDLAVGDRVLSAYNVHLPVQLNLAPRRFLGFVAERDAARRAQLRALEADVAANPHPVLVGGDFNTTPAMGDLRPLRDRLRDAADASAAGYPATWPDGRLPALWRLDWTLTSPAVRVHRYELRAPAGLSDHRAQQALISLPEVS